MSSPPGAIPLRSVAVVLAVGVWGCAQRITESGNGAPDAGGAAGSGGAGGGPGAGGSTAGGGAGGAVDSAPLDGAGSARDGAVTMDAVVRVDGVPVGDAGTSFGDGGPVAAGPCTALICEDFESGAIDKNTWGTVVGGSKNSVVWQSGIVAHGQGAVKTHVQDYSPQAFIYYKKALPPALSTHLFGRAYMYLTGYPTGHNILGWVGDSYKVIQGDRLLEFGADSVWKVSAYFDRGFRLGGTVMLNRWLCVEWEFTGLPQGAISLWVDGKLVIIDKNIGNGSPDTFVSFGLGHRSANAGADKPLDVYIDDVAIDTNRIGCIE